MSIDHSGSRGPWIHVGLALVSGVVSWLVTDLIRTGAVQPAESPSVVGRRLNDESSTGVNTAAASPRSDAFDFARASTEPLAAILARLFAQRTAEDSLRAWQQVIQATAEFDSEKAFRLISAMPDAIKWEAQGRIMADVLAKTGPAGVASALHSHVAPRLVMEGIAQLKPSVLLPFLEGYVGARPRWSSWDVDAWGKLCRAGAEDERRCWELLSPRIHELLKRGHPISELASGVPPAHAAEFLQAIDNPFSRSAAAAELSARAAKEIASDPEKVKAYLAEIDQAAGRSERTRGVKMLAQSKALADKTGSAVLEWVGALATAEQKEAAVASASYVFSDSRLLERILADPVARLDSVILNASLEALAGRPGLASSDVSWVAKIAAEDPAVAALLGCNETWQHIQRMVAQPR